MKYFNRSVGALKEDIAVNYVKKIKKYTIIECNFATKLGEIDIIARDKSGTIIFVEAKYRSTARYGLGREAVDQHKKFKIRNVATQYLRSLGKLDQTIRFDVIDILDDKITYIENAF